MRIQQALNATFLTAQRRLCLVVECAVLTSPIPSRCSGLSPFAKGDTSVSD
jgi:hypothetical protein